MKLAYKDIGKGKTVVFIHSYLWDKDMWLPQLNLLKDSFRCIAIDLPGHGDSEKNSNIIDLKNLAEIIKNTLDNLNVDSYTYVGLSVGGMLAPYLYQLDKDRIEKIIIMDSFSGTEPEQTKNLYFSMLDTIEKSRKIPDQLVERIAPIFFTPMIDKNGELFLNFKEKLQNIPEDKIDTIVNLGRVIFGRENSLQLLNSIEVPTYFITGEYDLPRPFYEAEMMKKEVKNSKIYRIKKAGHISNLENPRKVNSIFKNILK